MTLQDKASLKNNYKLIITKCFSVLHKIFKNSNLILNKYQQIEKYMEPLMKYMKTPNKIDFDDDLIDIMIIIIKTLKYLPNLAINLLPDLGQVLRKNKGMTKNLFSLINLYIIYSKGELENKEDNSKILFKLYKKSFTKEFVHKESAYLCTIIMEIWFIMCSIIPQKTVQNIISFAYERLQDIYFGETKSYSNMTKVGFDYQILGLGLSNLILASFVNYSKYVSEIININDMIIYASYIAYNKLFFSTTEYKIYSFSLCSILRNKNLISIINSNSPKIISFCYNILKKLKKKEFIIFNNSNESNDIKGNNGNNLDSDDDTKIEDDNEELDQDKKKNNKIKKKKLKAIYNLDIQITENTYGTYNNDIKYENNLSNSSSDKDFNYKEIDCLIFFPLIQKENEFIFFRETLEIFKSENSDMFFDFYNNLSNEEKNNLQDLVGMTRESH
jgi:hypothetical protein